MEDFIAIMEKASREAGREIMKYYDFNSFNVMKKEDNSLVTNADFASNEIFSSYLAKTKLPLCSEEELSSNQHKLFWLLDPLDGTNNFIDKNGNFCICLALIKEGFPLLSSIYLPTKKEFFLSYQGKNYKNSQPCTLENNANKLLVNLSKVNKYEEFAQDFSLEVEKIGSAIKFTKFATLKNLIYLRLGSTYIWDTAAGELLVKNAGGIMLDLKSGKEINYSKKEFLNGAFLALSKSNISKADEILSYLKERRLF